VYPILPLKGVTKWLQGKRKALFGLARLMDFFTSGWNRPLFACKLPETMIK